MWMQKLVQTYDNNIENWWNNEENPMAPICHIVKTAQIEIVITKDGEFVAAKELEKNAYTLIPVTEMSGSRTSGISPHALCDMLPYVAGDYVSYCKAGKEQDTAEEKNKLYMEELEKWASSEKYSHPKVMAIYKYVSKNTLLWDCYQEGIVKLTDYRKLEKTKVSGQPYEKCVVRFKVIDEDGVAEGTWEDRSLIDTFIKYYLNREGKEKDTCYMSGEVLPMATIHPKGILAAAYGAKLISANDNVGFTYRGRFDEPEQAFGMGYESSQKIHSALTWVAKRYGTYIGSTDKRMLMIWNPNGKDIPNIYRYTLNEEESNTEEIEDAVNQVENYQKKLWKSLRGFRRNFDESDEVIIMGLEAATTGRLSITYYQELTTSDFLQNIEEWQNSCRWYFLRFDDKKKPYYNIESPNFLKIVECALGRERGNFIDLDDKLLKEHVQVLTKCMLEKQFLPYYIVSNLFERASTPLAYSHFNREKVLSVACAVISKYITDSKKEGRGSLLDMTLDKENMDRSYLFGRLLAVYEKIERSTYVKGETREPNAIRLQNTFVNRPLYTMGLLDRQITPYLQKHSTLRRAYYKKILSEIVDKLYLSEKETLNKKLEETYLLGYYMQRAELNKKKGEENNVGKT